MSKVESVKEYVINKIKDGTWKIGDKIASEGDLSKTLNVARNSVREAMAVLEQEKIIIKRVGYGSTVSENASKYTKKMIWIVLDETDAFKKIEAEQCEKIINDMGYTTKIMPYEAILGEEYKDLFGIISFCGNYSFDKQTEQGIPVVNVNSLSKYPAICENFTSLYFLAEKIIKDDGDKKVICFNFTNEDIFNVSKNKIYYGMNSFFKTKYNLKTFSSDMKKEEIYSAVNNFFFKFSENYDLFIFLNDIIFLVFEKELKEKYKDKKIMVFSNHLRDKDMCVIGFDFDEKIKKAMEYLINLYKGEFLSNPVYIQEPIVF